MGLTAEDLHAAADLVGSFGADETRLASTGLPFEALRRFVEETVWHDGSEHGPLRDVDPQALAMGISIGVAAVSARPPEYSVHLLLGETLSTAGATTWPGHE